MTATRANMCKRHSQQAQYRRKTKVTHHTGRKNRFASSTKFPAYRQYTTSEHTCITKSINDSSVIENYIATSEYFTVRMLQARKTRTSASLSAPCSTQHGSSPCARRCDERTGPLVHDANVSSWPFVFLAHLCQAWIGLPSTSNGQVHRGL